MFAIVPEVKVESVSENVKKELYGTVK